MENIQQIEIAKIIDHPYQSKVYNDAQSKEMEESVRLRGILQPIIVTQGYIEDNEVILNNERDTYICVSGHRRKSAAIANKMTEIPAITRTYSDNFFFILDFLESNRFRTKEMVKSKAEKRLYYQISCQIGKFKQMLGVRIEEKKDKESLGELLTGCQVGLKLNDFEVKKIENFVDALGLNITDPFSSRDVCSKAGIARSEHHLFDLANPDYCEKKVERWRDVLGVKEADKFTNEWLSLVNSCDNDEVTPEVGAKIDNIIKLADAKCNKLLAKKNGVKQESKPKKQKAEKLDCYLSLPITDNPNYLEDAAIYEKTLKSRYKVINPVTLGQNKENQEQRQLSYIEHLENDLFALAKCKVIARCGSAEMRANSLGCRIEDAVASILGLQVYEYSKEG